MEKRVVLIQPPFGTLDMPSVGLSTLKASLTRFNIDSTIIYASNLFARLLRNIDLYNRLSLIQSTSLAAEWIFATEAFPNSSQKHLEYFEKILRPNVSVPMLGTLVTAEELLEARSIVKNFLTLLTKEILAFHPRIVGFSTLFQQTCPSLAIAKYLKEVSPELITVLGGGNCFYPMNQALKEISSPIIDFIFEGEADFAFKDFCVNLLQNDGQLPTNSLIEFTPAIDLDLLPFPDYDDYFAQLQETGITLPTKKIGFESSRGCWWGQKTNCLFCGLNGPSLQYKRKSLARIQEEIEHLSTKYQPDYLQATDNIMPKDLPTGLSNLKLPPNLKTIYYEVKPTLTFDELNLLEKSRINALQPGIESLNDHLLQLLRKGLTGANNVRFLRDCKTLGIRTDWNLLYAIPGEQKDDYEDIIRIIPKITHLRPADYIGPINIQRYSPLFNEPEKYEICNIKPVEAYSHVFPDDTNTENLALYFDSEFKTIFQGNLKNRLTTEVEKWKQSWQSSDPPSLRVIMLNEDYYLVEDSRKRKLNPKVLTKDYFSILHRLLEPDLIRKVRLEVEQAGLEDLYRDLLSWDFIVEIGTRVVSLLCYPRSIVCSSKTQNASRGDRELHLDK